MTGNEYQAKALRTASANDMLLNGILGLIGEVGEVADHVKKALYQGHRLDYDHLAEELGDIMWYIAITAEAIGTNLDDVMALNVEKLEKRYPKGFEKERSVNREV